MSTCAGPATEVSSATKKLNADSERQLIVRAKNGDEAAFAALFDAHKKRVYSICLRITGNIAQAEDLTQDAFMADKTATLRREASHESSRDRSRTVPHETGGVYVQTDCVLVV